jgi:hypothetical protein
VNAGCHEVATSSPFRGSFQLAPYTHLQFSCSRAAQLCDGSMGIDVKAYIIFNGHTSACLTIRSKVSSAASIRYTGPTDGMDTDEQVKMYLEDRNQMIKKSIILFETPLRI